MHASIPTTYRGIRFRSRLEAKWAYWLDWKQDTPWQYEPFDMDGYIPDFLLTFANENNRLLLAEVKPTVTLEGFIDTPDGEKVKNALMANEDFRENYFGFILLGISPSHCWILLRDNLWYRLPPPPAESIRAWAHAGNKTQWKASR